MVRAPVHVQARAAISCAGGSTGSTGCPGGEYELIDYKTGRPKSADQLADDVQLSLYAVGAREAWRLEASQQAYYYLLDDQKVAVPGDERRPRRLGPRGGDRGRRGDPVPGL